MALTVWNLLHSSANSRWETKDSGGTLKAQGATKEQAIKNSADAANAAVKAGNQISVRIHNMDGKYEEERTYPRSADPSSPG